LNFLPARLATAAARVAIALHPAQYPLRLAELLPFHYAINIQTIAGLTIGAVRAWFAARRLPDQFGNLEHLPDRRLYGCMVAGGGRGVIFVDANASTAEQRFTIAHEFSHFLLDHLIPREEALAAFGTSIRPVIDGERAPTDAERLEALRDWLDIQPSRHLMERESDGSLPELRTARAEHDADLLALEILAPHATVLARAPAAEYDWMVTALFPLLTADFGLPESIARGYAAQIAGQFAREPSLRRRFGNSSL
jgi:hypothetical protein